MMIYRPRTNIKSKLERRASRLLNKRMIKPALTRPIISISFDDCPQTALLNAAPMLEENNWRGTFYMAMGLCGTTNHLGLHMTEDDVKAAHKNGHEIANHTFSHIDGQQTSQSNFLADIDKNQAALDALNLPLSQNFAYPYGCVSPKLKSRIAKKFKIVRGVHNPAQSSEQTSHIDTALLPSMRIYSGDAVEAILRKIEHIKKHPQWLTLFTHDVRDTPSDYGCTPNDMARIIDAIKESGAIVLPLIDALNYTQNRVQSSGDLDV